MNGVRTSTSRRAGGFTLVELVLAAAISVILLGAMTSALVITTRALDQEDSPAARIDDAADASRRIVSELKLAINFNELTANAVTFTVPDRDGDGAADTIRYAWSGTAGDPLTVSYNGAAAVVVVDDVHHFNLPYLSTVVAGSGGAADAPEESADLEILMVVDDAGELDAQELARKFLLQAWGHQVTAIGQEEPLSVFLAEIPAYDLLYVPTTTADSKLKDKVRQLPLPAVIENIALARFFGLMESNASGTGGQAMTIVDSTHYITRLFPFAGIALFTADDDVSKYDADLGSALVLGRLDGIAAMALMEAGDPMQGTPTGPAPARRVFMPWGKNSMNFNLLTDDGRTVLKRSLEWAANAELPDPPGATEGSLLFALEENPAFEDKVHSVQDNDWMAASLIPTLPADAVSWRVNGIRFMAQRNGDADQTLVIQLRRRGFGGQPLGEVLGQTTFHEVVLPVEIGWVTVPIQSTVDLLPNEGICVAIGIADGSNAGKILVDENDVVPPTTANNQYWKKGPASWEYDEDRDVPFELYGTVETP